MLPGLVRAWQRCSCCCCCCCAKSSQPAAASSSESRCCPCAKGTLAWLAASVTLLLVLSKFAGTVVDDIILDCLLGLVLLCGVVAGVAALLSAEQKWPLLLLLFGVYTGLSTVNDDLLQAATTAPIAAAVSIWLIRRGRAECGEDGRHYTLEQLLPTARELMGWAAMVGAAKRTNIQESTSERDRLCVSLAPGLLLRPPRA